MEQSNFIKGLLSKIVESNTVDYDGEFGHMVKEYCIRLPSGAVCTGAICNDAYCGISKEENQRRIEHMWQVVLNIQRSAYISEQATKGASHTPSCKDQA